MKKLRLHAIAAALLTLLAVGCSEESSLQPQEPSMPKRTNPYSIPLEEALANADAMISNLSGPATRGIRLVEKVEVMRKGLTRASNAVGDTMLYLVNYSDNGGFALLGADRRLPEIFAFSDEGRFEFADTNENKALAFYMNKVADMIAELPPDTIPTSAYIPPSTDPYFKYRSNYDIYGPWLSKEMSLLNQYAPYNKYIPNKPVAGCVPVAFAAYLSHYRQPKSYGGYTFPWEEMRADRKHDMIPRFISLLWGDKLLQAAMVLPNKPKGGVLPNRYVPALNELGITVPNGLQAFDPEEICNILYRCGSLPGGAPVLVRGNLGEGQDGHAWVVDGALKQVARQTIAAVKPTLNPNIPLYYFHCVWGWGGKNNGFFNFDDLALGGTPDFLGRNDADIPGTIRYNFTHDLQYIGYITF